MPGQLEKKEYERATASLMNKYILGAVAFVAYVLILFSMGNSIGVVGGNTAPTPIKIQVKNIAKTPIIKAKVIAKTPKVKVAALKISKREADLLARLVRAEAEGENLKAQIGVANVVLNRVKQ